MTCRSIIADTSSLRVSDMVSFVCTAGGRILTDISRLKFSILWVPTTSVELTVSGVETDTISLVVSGSIDYEGLAFRRVKAGSHGSSMISITSQSTCLLIIWSTETVGTHCLTVILVHTVCLLCTWRSKLCSRVVLCRSHGFLWIRGHENHEEKRRENRENKELHDDVDSNIFRWFALLL